MLAIYSEISNWIIPNWIVSINEKREEMATSHSTGKCMDVSPSFLVPKPAVYGFVKAGEEQEMLWLPHTQVRSELCSNFVRTVTPLK